MTEFYLIALTFGIVTYVYFFRYFLGHYFYGRHLPEFIFIRIIEIWVIVAAPIFFLLIADFGQKNDCCTDSALFSPGHHTGIYILIVLYVVAYFYSSYRIHIATPIIELLINSLLIMGLLLNVLLCIQISGMELGGFFWVIGNVPIIMLLLMMLSHNQKKLHAVLKEFAKPNNIIAKFSWYILQAKPLLKFPLLFIVALPITLLLSLILFVFGQQPDTLIRAFTDTYKHGFSQYDYLCDNVACGGHYLCSVAANGHKKIVKPERYGERNGRKIICNRQLLIANAFEELIQCRFPFAHTIIRRYYNKVGDVVHTYYAVFNNKYVADIVYLLMKPLELLFLVTLYLFDKKPENRIAKQYLSKRDKLKLTELSL